MKWGGKIILNVQKFIERQLFLLYTHVKQWEHGSIKHNTLCYLWNNIL